MKKNFHHQLAACIHSVDNKKQKQELSVLASNITLSAYFMVTVVITNITESVDSVCRDGTDMPYVAIQTEA